MEGAYPNSLDYVEEKLDVAADVLGGRGKDLRVKLHDAYVPSLMVLSAGDFPPAGPMREAWLSIQRGFGVDEEDPDAEREGSLEERLAKTDEAQLRRTADEILALRTMVARALKQLGR